MVTTERAKHFYSAQDVPVTLYSDADEWEVSDEGRTEPITPLFSDKTLPTTSPLTAVPVSSQARIKTKAGSGQKQGGKHLCSFWPVGGLLIPLSRL